MVRENAKTVQNKIKLLLSQKTDLRLHCMLMPVCPNDKVSMVKIAEI